MPSVEACIFAISTSPSTCNSECSHKFLANCLKVKPVVWFAFVYCCVSKYSSSPSPLKSPCVAIELPRLFPPVAITMPFRSKPLCEPRNNSTVPKFPTLFLVIKKSLKPSILVSPADSKFKPSKSFVRPISR